MRAILTIACASVVFAAGAQAQDALKLCRQIKDDAERLKCYDGLDTSSLNATGRPAERQPGAGTAWVVNDEKTPPGDSPPGPGAVPTRECQGPLQVRRRERRDGGPVS